MHPLVAFVASRTMDAIDGPHEVRPMSDVARERVPEGPAGEARCTAPSPPETPTASDGANEPLAALVRRLELLHARIMRFEALHADRLRLIPERRRSSARNLLHYVSLRQQDLRSLQEALLRHGLSSIGRCEANVHATIAAVIDVLCHLTDCDPPPKTTPVEVDFTAGRALLERSTLELFGHRPTQGGAHIMVTMPSEAAHDRTLVADLLTHGMDCMRINCAHDDPTAWSRMIDSLGRAREKQGRSCRILMDLAGPKLRTGPIEPGPAVRKWRPRRDACGRVIAPARIWFHLQDLPGNPPLPADASVPICGDGCAPLAVGTLLEFTDAGGRRRRVHIVEAGHGGWWGECAQTAYVTPGLELHVTPGEGHELSLGTIGAIDPPDPYLVLHRGDRLLLGDDRTLGAPARHGEHGQLVRPASIGCTLPAVFKHLTRGERELDDDGKSVAVVEAVHEHHAVLEVRSAGPNGTKLRADKGINLPDTNLHLGAITEKDIEDLTFAVEHADMVGFSFVRRAEDVERLQKELARLGRPDMPIVLKIENRQAFEGLPSLLLVAMRSPASGVMIARGDLAVELGWQRLAEVQEEILWMCEAAHMPVVWATQVLESLAKTGTPSRAEITDAAMGVRAESVMLNKGPHILEALRLLADILRRMQDHQVKKRPLLRRLHLADDLVAPAADARPAGASGR